MVKLLLFPQSCKKLSGSSVVRRGGAIILINLLFVLFTFAQQVEIKGIVLEETTKIPIIGATIQTKGKQFITQSDAEGHFQIKTSTLPATINVSAIGFRSQEIDIYDASEPVSVLLPESLNRLNTVVVIGYGTQKQSNLIGSVSQITGEQLSNRPVTNLANALTGNLPGVTVIQNSGKPGADGSTIRVRGVGSFGATPSALVLVDGIPGTLNELNPDDIESISVLKDASTAAIYGARAANGVILVTTKKGKQGKTRINYNGQAGWQAATEFPKLANSWEYATMYNIANGSTSYTEEQIAAYKAGNDPDNYPNTNFLEEVFSRKGIQTSHDLSISGGGEKANYFASFGYLNQDGLVEDNYYKRYNARLNLGAELYKGLTATINLSGSKEERNEPQTNGSVDIARLEGITTYAVRYPAIYVGKYSDGTYGTGNQSVGTPVAWLESGSYYKSPSTKFNANVRLDWKPVTGLTLSGIAGYNYYVDEALSYRASQVLNPSLSLSTSFLNQSRDVSTYKTVQGLANYLKSLDKHNFDLLLGYSFEAQDYDYFGGYRESFPSNDYTDMSMGGTSNQQSTGYNEGWALQSYFGRFKYNYDQRYLFEATLRYDGSSRFSKDKRFGTFPSLAAGWVVSDEAFFTPLKEVVSNLKLKTSWGILGNQNISNYPYQSTLTTGLNYPIGGSLSNGAGVTVLTDKDIHWESTRTIDGGVELSLVNGLIDIDATYFNKYTYNILYQPASSVSSVLGMSLSQLNIGSVRNSGFEFQVAHQQTFNDFSYKVTGILSIINNKVASLGVGGVAQTNGMVGNGSDLFVGYPMQMYYGYKTDGVFTNQEEIAEWTDQTKVNPSSQVGDIRYLDLNKDGVVDQKDQTYLGSNIPKYNYSLNLELGYKGIDLKAFFQGVGEVSGRLTGYAGYAFYNVSTIQQWQIKGRFDPENPARYPDYPRLQSFSNTTPPNYVTSDFWILNAAYCRLKNLQVGYTLPKNLLKNIKVEKLRIYFSGENLFTINDYREGWDPEINTSGTYYPILASYTFGVNIGF